METQLLDTIIVISGLSLLIVFLFNKLKIPTIVGFLLTGVMVGPHGLGLVKAIKEVHVLAEIGVILLVFATGIEFSFQKLLKMKKLSIIGGFCQVILTTIFVFLIAKLGGKSTGTAIFLGLAISHTSTAIMLKILQARGESDSPHGHASLAVSLFQDIASVAMMLFVPLLAGEIAASEFVKTLSFLGIKAIGIIIITILSAVWLVPWLFYQVLRTRSYELFMISIVGVCFAVAWLTSMAGLSLALGAFLAGLIVSESKYSKQILSNVLPFRDVFTSFFFVSVGMLVDIRFILEQPFLILAVALVVLFLKAMIASVVILSLGLTLRAAVLGGILLCQVGEFSFILAQTGLPYNLLTPKDYQWLLALVVVTMTIAPFLMQLAPYLISTILKLPVPKRWKGIGDVLQEKKENPLHDHVIIIGFGVNGRNLAQVCKSAGISYVIIELNAKTVKEESLKGEPILYGDATQAVVLEHAAIQNARVAVVAISDPEATLRITEVLREIHSQIHIITRIRYMQEINRLYSLGANEVIPEELEASVEIFTRVLKKYLVPKEEIEKFISEIRLQNYQMMRPLSTQPAFFSHVQLNMANFEINAMRLQSDSPFIGKSLAEIDMRKKYGITVLAIRRKLETISNPEPSILLEANDVLICMGSPSHIAAIAVHFGK